MAEEVINQLAGVAVQIRSARENQPDNFQELLDEWNENFPKSSNSYGSPKSVAAILERQSLEIDELRCKLKSEMCSREEEISQIMMSVNKQLNASCRSVMTERHQATLTQLQNDARHEKLIAAAKSECDLVKSSCSASYDITLMKMQSKNAELEHEAKKSNAALEAEISAQQLAHDCELKSVTKLHQIEHDKFANQISQLEKKLQAKKSSRSAINEVENSLVPNPSKSNISYKKSPQYESVPPAKVEKKVHFCC